MRCAAVAGVLLSLAGAAAADDTSPAREHARSSTTLYLSTTWSPAPTVPIRAGVDSALRLHHKGMAAEMRLGVGIAASALGLAAHGIAHGGFSLGGAFPLGSRVVVAPMLSLDAFVDLERFGRNVWVHYATIAMPLSIVFERGMVIELFVQAGYARYYGTTDPAIVAGPRIGLVF